MRKFLALVLALVMTMSLVTVSAGAATSFTDDAKITNAEAVEVLSAMGVLGGYADGSFRPEATLTRGAGAKLIAYLMLGQAKADKLTATYTVFEDVTDTVGLAPYIEWAAANGIVGGYGDGNFGPYDTLTQYAFGKMLLGVLGYDAKEEGYVGAGWQKNVYGDANYAGIFDGTETYAACTRDDAARMALGALKANVVAYGQSQLGGDAIYWNGILLTTGVDAWVDGRVETNRALWTFYPNLNYVELAADTFGRPGHYWSYNFTFEKFYMDAPVAEYTTAVTDCQILVDCGIAKNNKNPLPVEYIENGAVVTAEAAKSHAACATVHGGQGVLTQVFKVTGADEKTHYVVTEIDTYLAQVGNVTTTSHKVLGQTDLTAYVANNNWMTDDDNSVALVADLDLGYKKNDYVLVNLSNVGATVPAYLTGVAATTAVLTDADADFLAKDKYDYVAESLSGNYTYVGVVGAPSVITAATYSGRATDYSMVTVNGVREKVAAQYELSKVAMKPVIVATDVEVVNFFVDQYGNMIGDAPYAYAYTYGVISAAKWMDPNSVLEAEYAEVKIHDMANPAGAAVKVKTINNTAPGYQAGADRATYKFSDIIAENAAKYYATADIANSYLGLVKNYGDGKLEYVDALLTAGTTNFVTSNPNLTDALASVYVNNETEFLVKKSATEYVTYTGIDTMPTMTNATAVAVTETGDTYACFVYVDATNAVYPGSETVVFVANPTAQYVANAEVYEYTMFVNGAPATLFATKDAVAVAGGTNGSAIFGVTAGLYKLSFNEAGMIIKVVAAGHTANTTAGVVEDDYKLLMADAKAYDVATAKVYFAESLTSTTDWTTVGNVIVGNLANIANGQTVLVKTNAVNTWVVEEIYVLNQVVEYTK